MFKSALESLNTKPQHIAVIMDGNGRWAEKRFLPRIAGYQQGVQATKRLITWCAENHIKALTIFAFSSENWRRPAAEVKFLMDLFLQTLRHEVDKLHHNRIQLQVIGQLEDLNLELQKTILEAQTLTQDNQALKLRVALNYGGQWDCFQAARKLAQLVEQGMLKSAQLTEQDYINCLSLGALECPDLLIRTGGERRISNFLLWHLAYTEIYFSDLLWPDFKKADFIAALEFFATRERRFGNVSPAEQVHYA